MSAPRRIALAGGLHLSARVQGPADAPLLVLLHGFPQAGFIWEPLIERLCDRFLCVAPDLRGYGDSSAPAEVEAYRTRHLVQDIVGLVEAVRPHDPVADAVVAHDWGGAVAWALAASRADRLRRLMIINSPHPATFLRDLRDDPDQQAASRYMNLLCRPDAEARLSANGFERLFGLFTGMGADDPGRPGGGWLDEAMRNRYRALWSAGLTGPLNYYRASPLRPPETAADRDALARLALPESLTRVDVPTRVLWGLQDTALRPRLLEGLEAHVPRLEVVRLEGLSHWVIDEDPQRVAAEVAGFVDASPAG